MYKQFGKIFVGLFLVVMVFVPTAFDKLFALLFVGMVPFTNYVIAPNIMIGFYAILLSLTIYAVANQTVTIADTQKRENASRNKARAKVYKKTAVGSAPKTDKRTKKRFQATNHA